MEFLKKYSGIIATLSLVIAIGVAIFGSRTVINPVTEKIIEKLGDATGYGELEFQDYGTFAPNYSIGGITIASATSTAAFRNTTGAAMQIGRGFVKTFGTATGTLIFNVSTSSSSGVSLTAEPTTRLIVDTFQVATGTRAMVFDTTAGGQKPPNSGTGTTSSFVLENNDYLLLTIHSSSVTCASGAGSTAGDPTRGHCPASTSTDRFSSDDKVDFFFEVFRK